MGTHEGLEFSGDKLDAYHDVWTSDAREAMRALAPLEERRQELLRQRAERRRHRAEHLADITVLDPGGRIDGTSILVSDARAGNFVGAEIPADLECQWVQGTGPATRPRATTAQGLRNVAYALLSGADGWMFDGEDALGQVDAMSLENHRNLALGNARAPLFLEVAERVSAEMNVWARGFLGQELHSDWRAQLEFTTMLYRARGLHLDDRHVRLAGGRGFSASIVDAAIYVANNHRALAQRGSSIALYLPKIQTAGEAALWNEILGGLEAHFALAEGTIKAYVLVEQIEASFQLMEIRAALGRHFVGFNTGRWDYINSVADPAEWHPDFVDPNIDAITMTYAYMAAYEDRVRRAVNTPDREGRCALWQGGMEPNIPVGSSAGVAAGMEKAVAGGEREQRAGASGKWVAHWKMVPIVRPVWAKVGEKNQLGRSFPPLSYAAEDAAALKQLAPAPRTVRGARDLLSVALQYGNAFLRGFQAAALKPADAFGDDDVLYLMEDMATGEIRCSILWEWLHKGGRLTENDPSSGVEAGDEFTHELYERLLHEEYEKLRVADDRDVHDDSKATTLPIAREIVATCVASQTKLPWYIDLLNLNLGVAELGEAKQRIRTFVERFHVDGDRLTENLDFVTTTRSAS